MLLLLLVTCVFIVYREVASINNLHDTPVIPLEFLSGLKSSGRVDQAKRKPDEVQIQAHGRQSLMQPTGHVGSTESRLKSRMKRESAAAENSENAGDVIALQDNTRRHRSANRAVKRFNRRREEKKGGRNTVREYDEDEKEDEERREDGEVAGMSERESRRRESDQVLTRRDDDLAYEDDDEQARAAYETYDDVKHYKRATNRNLVAKAKDAQQVVNSVAKVQDSKLSREEELAMSKELVNILIKEVYDRLLKTVGTDAINNLPPASALETKLPAEQVRNPAARPASNFVAKPEVKAVAKPMVKRMAKPMAKPASKPTDKSLAKPANKLAMPPLGGQVKPVVPFKKPLSRKRRSVALVGATPQLLRVTEEVYLAIEISMFCRIVKRLQNIAITTDTYGALVKSKVCCDLAPPIAEVQPYNDPQPQYN